MQVHLIKGLIKRRKKEEENKSKAWNTGEAKTDIQ